MKNTAYVINTPAALGADASIANGILQVAGLQIPVKGIQGSPARQAYVLGVSQITTCVVTAANSTTYGMSIISNSTTDGSSKTWTVPDFTSDSTTTRTEVATVLMNAFNAFNDMPVTASLTGSGANKDLVLTADIPWYKFTAINSLTAAGVIVPTPGTAGVNAIGAGSVVLTQPFYNANLASSDSIISTNNYSTYMITYLDQAAWGEGTHETQTYSVLYLYVNEGGSHFDTLSGTYGTLTMGLKGISAAWAAVGANVAFGSGVAVRASGSFVTELLSAGDALSIGEVAASSTAKVVQPYTDGSTAANFIFADAVIDNAATVSSAAAFYIKFTPAS